MPKEFSMLDKKDLQLLFSVGLLGAANGDMRRSLVVFDALVAYAEQRNYGYIGKGFAYTCGNRLRQAIEVMEVGLRVVEPYDRAELKAFLSLTLMLAGRTVESQRYAREAGDVPLADAMRQHNIGLAAN
jgi:hypothetical protein